MCINVLNQISTHEVWQLIESKYFVSKTLNKPQKYQDIIGIKEDISWETLLLDSMHISSFLWLEQLPWLLVHCGF